jgi:glycosyltransferase involved in cell wall biosynthesis
MGPDSPGCILWEGDQFSAHSLATVNRALCSRLLAAGVVLRLLSGDTPTGGVPAGPLTRLVGALGPPPAGTPVEAVVRHAWPPRLDPPAAKRWVQAQPWEFGGVPRRWIDAFDRADDVWVPSSWVRDCYIASGQDPERVHVVPCGVDAQFFRPDGPRRPYGRGRAFRFLFVGGLIHRKGIDLLVNAYARAFGPRDDVCLVIKGFGSAGIYASNTREQLLRLAARDDLPAIEIVDEEMDAEGMATLYRSCDALVHPYRGEGFALPVIEAMASGTPVITTGYGAVLDYADELTASLLPVSLAPAPNLEEELGPAAGLSYFLAEPDAEALIAALRALPGDEARVTRAETARERVSTAFSWDQAAAVAHERLSELTGTSNGGGAPAEVTDLFFLVEPASKGWEAVVRDFVSAVGSADRLRLRLGVRGGPDDAVALGGRVRSVIMQAGRNPATCAAIEVAPVDEERLRRLEGSGVVVLEGRRGPAAGEQRSFAANPPALCAGERPWVAS